MRRPRKSRDSGTLRESQRVGRASEAALVRFGPHTGWVAVQDDIFEWVRGFPAWKQDLFIRASAKPELDQADVDAALGFLLGEHDERTGPREVVRADMPGGRSGDQPLVLDAISDVENANALVAGQTLRFRHRGLTITYGANGAGKTGYVRILKHAGRTLHREPIRRNLLATEDVPPSASVSTETGGTPTKHRLALDAIPPPELARICVFDAKAGARYISRENEVDYVPAALNSVERLADALVRLNEEVERRVAQARPGSLDLRPYGEETAVRRHLAALSATTLDVSVVALATLSVEEQSERQRLREKLGEIIANNASKLRETAEREGRVVRALRDDLPSIAEHVDQAAIEAVAAELARLTQTEEAARAAAARFEAEPVDGVGTEPWHVLWDAAKAFALNVHGHGLPPDHDPAHCPLCMQTLDADARKRFADFEAFVTEDINSQRLAAKRAVDARRAALPDLDAFVARHKDAFDLIGREPDDAGHELLDWLREARVRVERIRAGTVTIGDALATPSNAAIDAWVTARAEAAEQHRALENVEEQRRIRTRLAELDARVELHERSDEVLHYLAGLREVSRLEAAAAKLSTTGVSTKITAFSKEFIKADLESALNEQLRALYFTGLEVETTTRTVAGTPRVGLSLKTTSGAPLAEVLSEGEQRRLALAMFLAEMSIGYDESPIVLDDPVCSIDQEGRRHIARMLIQLAQERQVIVFTHELSFVNALRIQAEHANADVGVHVQHVVRLGRAAGHVRASLPWEGLSPKDRIAPLMEKLKAAEEAYARDDPEVYGPPVHEFCNYLRRSFERTVEEKALGGVVRRGDDSVHTQKLKDVVLTDEVRALVDRGMGENNPWMHDRSLTDSSMLPTVDEMRGLLACYEELLATLQAEQQSRDRARARRKTARKATLTAVETGGLMPAPDGATESEPEQPQLPKFARANRSQTHDAPRPA
jgi:hypothetical protein